MRSYLWYVLGVYLAFFAALFLGACAFDASGTGSDPVLAGPSGGDSVMHVRPVEVPRSVPEGLVVEMMPNPQPMDIAVATKRVQVAWYRIRNADATAHEVTRINVCTTNAMAVESFQYAWDDGPLSKSHPFPEEDGCVTFLGMNTAFPAKSAHELKLFATFATISQDPTEVPRSGERIVTELAAVFDENTVEVPIIAGDAERFILRKSKVSIVEHPMADAGLRPGWSDLFQFGVTSDGDVAIKQFTFKMEVELATLCKFRFRKNGVLMDASTYNVYGIPPGTDALVDLKTNCVSQDMTVYVVFPGEQRVLSGNEPLYALRADIVATDSFCRVSTGLNRGDVLATSQLSCTGFPLAELVTATGQHPGIIWSDLSDVPHNASYCASSADWIGDASVLGASISQVLE